MNLRSSVAALLVLTLALEMPVTARAQESPTASTSTTLPAFVRGPSPIDARLALLGAEAAPAPVAFFARTPEEIRLSHGARTALIVTAIVVGSLIILGLVVVSRPSRL